MRSLSRAAGVLAAGLAALPVHPLEPLAAQAPARAPAGARADVVVHVYDQEAGRPIPAAGVTLGDTHRGTTDETGRVVLRGVPPGSHALRVSALGFEPREDAVSVTGSRTVDIRIPLAVNPLDLDPIVVYVRSRWLETNGFYRRMESTPGRFLLAREIHEKNESRFVDLFHGVAGLRVEYDNLGNGVILSTRGTTTGGYRAYRVYIDGLPSDAFGYNGLSPEAVAGIEIYPGAHAPIEYGSGPVILVWTKG